MELRILYSWMVLAWCHGAVDGAAILALFSSLSFADHLVFRGYVSLLTQRGHSVVMMTPYPGQFQYPDVERIVELDVGQESGPFWDEFRLLMSNTDDYYLRLKAINELTLKVAIAQLKSKQMTALLINPNIKFDLVITEADVPVLYGAADKYKVPHIAITTSSGKIHQHEAKGNPVQPTLYPDVNALSYGSDLTSWQKVKELYRYVQSKNEFSNNYMLCDAAAKNIFGIKRDLQAVEHDIDMLFIATNPLLAGNRPVSPATVFVDRMHMRPGLGLPQPLQALLDSAEKGAVYFSLGAVQESEQLAPHILKTLTDAFKELPFTVLWKLGNATVINKPNNVHVLPWFPQQQILAHPNVRAFITHGGPRSLEEALFYQVPIVGLPLLKSRKIFIEQITNHGAGEVLDSYYLDKETIKKVVTEVANNPKYQTSMSKLKETVTDPMISGPDKAVLWTEYVLRHGGARHLRSPTVGLTFSQYYMMDLIAYVTVVALLLLYLTYGLLRSAAKRLRARLSLGKRAQTSAGKFKSL